MTVQDWPYLWSVRGRYGRRIILQARPIDAQYQYETVDADGFTDGGGYVDRAGMDRTIETLRADYPSLRPEE